MNKILVIDDSAVQAEHLQFILKNYYEVSVCNSGGEGLRMAKTGDFSLIILDIVMPDMDGFSILKELKSSSATRDVPVILITSLTDIHHEEKGFLLGAVDYITKPFNSVIVRARVNTHVELYHYQKRFKEMATVDTLTGVANRRSYDDESVLKWREAVRFGLPISICMYDIDKFKVYNDTFGHPAGDKVIATVAKTINMHLRRATDFFARYGGEEFSSIHLGDSALSVYEHIKEIRKEIEGLQIPHNPEVSRWVTISVGGVTTFPKSDESYDEYLKKADAMLYDAKGLGRNMVVWTSDTGERWKER
ncbi:MAG: diguanylate cyclase [Clostridium sp.]|nr:diguanylate cyclase [Clostridium sp.]